MKSKYLKEACNKVDSKDIAGALAILQSGLQAGDTLCRVVLYYLPEPDKITWHEKCSYMEKNFYQFDLDIDFNTFLSEYGPFKKPHLFRQCANELNTSVEELLTYDYFNWILEHELDIPRKQIESFWKKFMDVYLESTITSLVHNIDSIYNK